MIGLGHFLGKRQMFDLYLTSFDIKILIKYMNSSILP